MKITLLRHILRQAVCSMVLMTSLWACADDDSAEQLMPVISALQTEFVLVDSIKVDARYETASPTLWQEYRNQTYTVASQNKAEAYFYQDGQAVVLVLRDTSRGQEQAFVSFTFPNRTVNNLPATVSVMDTATVCVEAGQQFQDKSNAFSGGCLQPLAGTLHLNYDAATDVLSGSVEGLQIPLDYYVPKYSFPNAYGPALKASGSTRNLNITFQHVKRYQGK